MLVRYYKMRAELWLLALVLSRFACKCDGFQIFNQRIPGIAPIRRNTGINMVFDFIKKRAEEGFAQVQNIASKTLQGKMMEGLSDSAEYVRMRQSIDAENIKKLTEGLARSREKLLQGISSAFTETNGDVRQQLESLESTLLQADIGVSTTTGIIEDLRAYARTEGLTQNDILPVLRERLILALTPAPAISDSVLGYAAAAGTDKPTVIFVIGANGMGKTTTIGKLANRLRQEGNVSVLLGACDTYRAAAVQQLQQWSARANVSIETPTESELGKSPVAVVSRCMQRAKRENFDVLIIDTSGRLSNNYDLTQELQDMKAAIVREDPTAPHETLLVVDAAVGRNAVEQAAAWRKHVGVSGLVVTKMDGTARGGFVVSVVRDLGLTVKLVGVGEKINGLRDFQPEVFVDALLGNSDKQTAQLKAAAQRILSISGANLFRTQDSNGARSSGAASSVDSVTRLRESFQITSDVKDAKVKRAKRANPAAAKHKKK